MVTYFELGKDKQLNEIVVAGSHDAGITSGGGNVKTQSLDIGGQARAGVRVFDLRIAATTVSGQKAGSPKQAELRAFHANDKMMNTETKSRSLAGSAAAVELERTKFRLGAGDFGAGLGAMLRDAKNFVKSRDGAKEFLILKFDKCVNWSLIAEACVSELGDVLLKGHVNLNTTKLANLSGRVACVFSPKGLTEIALQKKLGAVHGILGFVNLYAGGSYTDDFPGLQYYGKGGTSVWKPFSKLSQNEKKQRKLVAGAKQSDPDVIGMMYWTTTGMFESIRKRNATMWDAPNVAKLKKLWAAGLEEFVWERNPLAVPAGSAAVGTVRKRSMPNIVMIDFADELKCREIRGLNDLSAAELAALGGDA
jgi:hypothetical protein